LPPIRKIAFSAAYACLPIVGLGLVLLKVKFCIGMLAGYLLCIVLYLFLREFVALSLTMFGSNARQTGQSGGDMGKGVFAVVSIGKFLVLGGIVAIILFVLHANIAGFITGFLLSQVGVTVMGAMHLKQLGK
jgi:hypothetical protein